MNSINISLAEWRPNKSLYQWGSLGIQYIAASLRNAKHSVTVTVYEGLQIEEVVESILSQKPQIVGIPLFRETKDSFYLLTELLKKNNPNLIIFTGGHTATLYAYKVLDTNPYVDMVVCGEGEETVVDICNRIEKGKGLADCRGIFFRLNNTIFKNPERSPIEKLDLLPFPVLDVIKDMTDSQQPNIFVTISTSRGCLGNCEFCVEHRVSKYRGFPQWRGRSPESVVNEIINIKNQFPHKRLIVNFVDGAFEDSNSCSKKRLIGILDLIEKNNIKMAFSFLTRAESWKNEDEELIIRMKKLGVYCVSIGLESGSQNTLKIFGKRATVEDNIKACKLFKSVGISVYGFLIMFHPFATLNDLRDTALFLKEEDMAHRPEVWSHKVYVYPDTKLFQRIIQNGLLIGTDETGYIYEYAFVDGRVGEISDIMRKISNLNSFIDFQLLLDKVSQEFELYEVWKNMYDEFGNTNDIIQNYKLEFDSIKKRVGICQYDLFVELVEASSNNILEKVEARVIENWEVMLKKERELLENRWMVNRMNLARKRLRIV